MRNTPVHSPEEQAAILNRLRTIQGHLCGAINMVENGRPCAEVLHQLRAIGAALHTANYALWLCEFQNSADIMLHDPNPEIRAAEAEHFASLCILQAHTSSEEFR